MDRIRSDGPSPNPGLHKTQKPSDNSQLPSGEVYAVCIMEIPMMNLLHPPAFAQTSLHTVQWTHGFGNFNQNWMKILWIGKTLAKAKKRLDHEAEHWTIKDNYHKHAGGSREYRVYAEDTKFEHQYRGKVYIEGPF